MRDHLNNVLVCLHPQLQPKNTKELTHTQQSMLFNKF